MRSGRPASWRPTAAVGTAGENRRASNRQKLDQWIRQDQRQKLRDLILALVPFAIALGAAWLIWRDPEAGSTLVHALTFPIGCFC